MPNNKAIETRRKTIERRNRDIRNRYNVLYNQKRIRHDDCLEKIAFEFYLSVYMVSRILQNSDDEKK